MQQPQPRQSKKIRSWIQKYGPGSSELVSVHFCISNSSGQSKLIATLEKKNTHIEVKFAAAGPPSAAFVTKDPFSLAYYNQVYILEQSYWQKGQQILILLITEFQVYLLQKFKYYTPRKMTRFSGLTNKNRIPYIFDFDFQVYWRGWCNYFAPPTRKKAKSSRSASKILQFAD